MRKILIISADGAVAGGMIGAGVGALIGAATASPDEPCYRRTRSGRVRRVACY
jgi:hypothetical protein